MNAIRTIQAEEIRDSRGRPTLKVTTTTDAASGSFSVPSGTSTGSEEALELRDEDGMEVKTALRNIIEEVTPALVGMDVTRQQALDARLCELDGTPQKSRLGGNALIGVSIACAKAAAHTRGLEPYEYLRTLIDIKQSRTVPYLFMNLINGGKHARSPIMFQEYLVIPDTESVSAAMNIGTLIHQELSVLLKEHQEYAAYRMGDEGGYALPAGTVHDPLKLFAEAAMRLKPEVRVWFGMDVAATTFYADGTYQFDGEKHTADGLTTLYTNMTKEFPLLSIEDPFAEKDFTGFTKLHNDQPNLMVIGDDLTVTNQKLLTRAIREKSVNAVIIKPNQIGTLSEALATMKLARDNEIECIVSHRSGETHDDFIADLAYAFGCFGLKSGAPIPAERLAKYNRLKLISER